MVDLVSVGPGGAEIDGAGDPSQLTHLAPTSLVGSEGVALFRQAARIQDEGYNVFLSQPVVLLADLRASAYYEKTTEEKSAEHCRRCDLVAEGLYSAADVTSGNVYRELLSGEHLEVRIPSALRTSTASFYTPFLLDASETEVRSVRWDMSPALRQEPTRNPSYGTGDVVPGTLLHSGEMSHTVTDVEIRGRGLDFAFVRTYRSQTVGSGPLGPGWDHNLRARLRELPNGDVEYYDGRGRRETFELQANGTLKPPPGRFVDLKKLSTGWMMLDAGHNKTRFDSYGRLQSISDAVKVSESTGNSMQLFYNSQGRLDRLRDSLDRDIYFGYDGGGRLEEIRDFTDRTFKYRYDTYGRLEKHETPAVTTYESPTVPERLISKYGWDPISGSLDQALNGRDNLKTLTDPKGQLWLSLTYEDKDGDSRNEEVTQQTWGGETVVIDYDFSAGTVEVTDRRSNLWHYELSATGQTKTIKDPSTAPWTFDYDDQGLLSEQAQPLGRKTTYTYDLVTGGRSRGNVKEIRVTPDSRGPNGSSDELVTTIGYFDLTNQPKLIEDPLGNRTVINRDGKNGLPRTIREGFGTPEASVTTIDYNDYGQPKAVTEPANQISQLQTKLDYYPDGPSRGYLEMVTVELGDGKPPIVTGYETDARGNPKATVDPRGVRSETDFNDLDQVIESRASVTGSSDGTAVAINYVTSFAYDRNGNLAAVMLPYDDGSLHTKTTYTYGVLDEIRTITREVEPGGATTIDTYDYDKNFNIWKIIDPLQNETEYLYNSRNLLEYAKRGKGPEPLPELLVTEYQYNSDGELETLLDGRLKPWSTEYDGYGRVRIQSDPIGNYSQVIYDDSRKAKKLEQYDNNGVLLSRSENLYDALNRTAFTTFWIWDEGQDPSGAGLAVYETRYNPSSQVVKTIAPLSRETTLFYDAAGRLYAQEDSAGNRVDMLLDLSGNAKETKTTEKLPDGEEIFVTVTSTYDALNRKKTQLDQNGNNTQWEYDARGHVVALIDPGLNVTTMDYDGLNRLDFVERPESITEDYDWYETSRLKTYKDSRGTTTRWNYDAAGRLGELILPGESNKYIYEYDAADNLETVTDPNGTVVVSTFDDASRLKTRAVTPALGVEGPVAEIFEYDGLNRMTYAQSGDIVATRKYDSMSRLLFDQVQGRTVNYKVDIFGNATRIAYPSGLVVGQDFDQLNRMKLVGKVNFPGEQTEEVEERASYRFRGPQLVDGKDLGNGLTGKRVYDSAWRLQGSTMGLPGEVSAYQEKLTWSPRNLKAATQRDDLNGWGFELGSDKAGRLRHATLNPRPVEVLGPQAEPSLGELALSQNRLSYTYDAAQNMTSREHVSTGEGSFYEMTSLPPDSSGWNRPESVGGTPLTYDKNGNLTAVGADRTLVYDFRNRLVRVEESGQLLASYKYDAFNRRIETLTGTGETRETVYSGWREIEEYTDGQLLKRMIYGLDLDEIVSIEGDFDNDGAFEEQFPVYDTVGNVAMLTDSSGKITARYMASPFGEVITARVDNTPPMVNQVRCDAGDTPEIDIEFSEGRRFDSIANDSIEFAINNVILPKSGIDATTSWTVQQPVETGPLADRRLRITLNELPPEGSEIEMAFAPDAMQDLFLNKPQAEFRVSFNWPASTSGPVAYYDATNPEVELVVVKDGYLEVTFNEPPDETAAANALEVDGTGNEWELQGDGYTVRSATPLADGEHGLRIEPGVGIDLAGKGVSTLFEVTLTSSITQAYNEVYRHQDESTVEVADLLNRSIFQGRPFDLETGLIYFRNRYYSPELGRFITRDPLGHVDGPSTYQFALNSPYNFSDPLGLENWGGCRGLYGRAFEICESWKRTESENLEETTKSVAGYAVGMIWDPAIDLITLPVTMTIAQHRAKKERLQAYLADGYEAFAAVKKGQIENQEKFIIRLPVNMVLCPVTEGAKVIDVYEKEGSFEGGRQLGRAFSCLEADITLVYGGAQALKSGRAYSRSEFYPPKIVRNEHGKLSNLHYTLNDTLMAPHKAGTFKTKQSQFLFWVDADGLVLDAAAYADANFLWDASNKAKVLVENGPIGVLWSNGELTSWVNLYRKKSGTVHGSPGTPP